jgi:hypothetical protein
MKSVTAAPAATSAQRWFRDIASLIVGASMHEVRAALAHRHVRHKLER